MSLSDPLVSAGLLLAFAGLILVVGLALQERANRRAGLSSFWPRRAGLSSFWQESAIGLALQERTNRRAGRSRPFWQESAEVDGDPRDEAVEAAQAPVTLEAAQAPVTNDRLPEDQPARQELDTRVQAFDSLTPTTAAISAIDDLEERLNTWIGRIEAGIAPAQEPITNDQPPEPVTSDQPQEPVTNDRPPEPVRNDQPPEVQRSIEAPSGANGSDGGRARTAPAGDLASENEVQEKDRRWLEEFIARTKAAEESCGRADEAMARVARLIEPPPSGPAE